jgi:hypothetical protein
MGFDPVSMAVISAGVGLAGAGTSFMGSQEQAQAAQVQAQAAQVQAQATSENAAYQAQVAKNNAAIASQDARFDIQAGETAAVNKGMKTRAAVGQEKAAQGAAGIDVNTGSAADVRAGEAAVGMLDASTIRSNAAKAAYAKEVEATSDTAQSQLLTAESSQALQGGALASEGAELQGEGAELAGEGTLLSNVSTVGGNWAKFQQNFGGVSNFNSGNPIY